MRIVNECKSKELNQMIYKSYKLSEYSYIFYLYKFTMGVQINIQEHLFTVIYGQMERLTKLSFDALNFLWSIYRYSSASNKYG